MTRNYRKLKSKHASFTKSEREYVKGIVHNLSFQRFTDREIAQWFHDEKQIDLETSTVTKMRHQIGKQAAKWYIELKKSTHVYIAAYKERLDSLFSYQKKLHEILTQAKKDEVKIRAISELQNGYLRSMEAIAKSRCNRPKSKSKSNSKSNAI